MSITAYNDKELLKQVAMGNEQAFKVIFDNYRARLYHYILGFIKSKEVSEEIVMDVFLKIWTGKEIATEIDNLNAFLFKVAHNKCIDFLRSASKDHKLTELLWDKIQSSSGTNPQNLLIEKQYEATLREAIESMPSQRKKVYKLSRDRDLTHSEISEELNISKNTVSNHIVKAQQFIRSHLIKNLDTTLILFILSQQAMKK